MRELTINISIPPPSAVPAIKDYKYNKAKDEVAGSAATGKESKDRYHAQESPRSRCARLTKCSNRTVSEGSRRLQSLSVHRRVNPATGLTGFVPFAAAAADRASFMQFDLSQAVPSATLQHLGAVVSKNPFDLVAIDTSKGVRGR